MEDIKAAKKELRAAMKTLLKGVARGDAEKASLGVLAELESLEQWKNSDLVLAFLSMEDELDTAPILRRVLEQGKMLAVPKVFGDDLVFYQIKNISSDTAPGAFGILEPVPGLPEIDMKTLSGCHSVALVPGLAFDKENFRLGRGKGFYDRFFASCGNSLYKIGTGYSFQLVEQVPHEAHDLKLDAIILSP